MVPKKNGGGELTRMTQELLNDIKDTKAGIDSMNEEIRGIENDS